MAWYSDEKLHSPSLKFIGPQRLNFLARWRNISITWPKFDIILLLTRQRDGILVRRDEVYGDSSFSWYSAKNQQGTTFKVIRPQRVSSVSSWRNISITSRPKFDFTLLLTRRRDGIVTGRYWVFGDSSLSWYSAKNQQGSKFNVIRPQRLSSFSRWRNISNTSDIILLFPSRQRDMILR